jgi:tetratricopeptide (TPR) repeat protein
MHSVAPRLMAYARSLDLDAKWTLAADVYETVIAHAHPVEESDVVVNAHLRLAYCQRSLGALDKATASYATASAVADDNDDMFGILRAQIGAAKIAIDRGNMPRAESLLDDVISRASHREDLSDVHAMALQDRAGVAFHRGRYDLAVTLAYESLERTEDPINRDRLLGDIALAFSRLGVLSAARDAYLVVEATAQEQYQRWSASMNLMELAAREGAMPVFERYRRSLASMPFPPAQRAQFHLQTAEGFEALHEYESAMQAGRRALEIADEFGYHQVRFDVDSLLQRVADGQQAAVRAAEVPVPVPLRFIAESISEMRRMVPR